MSRRRILYIGCCFSILFISGCWDRRELTERALWLVSGWDVWKDGGIELSGQIIIPHDIQTQGGGGSASGQGFFVTSAQGVNVGDALIKSQTKLSREAFFGHRRVVIFSEDLAKRGLKKILDANNRGSEVSFRTDVFIIKGVTAKEALSIENPLEKNPAIAPLKEHEETGGRGSTSYLHFLEAVNSDGLRPTMPVIEISHSQEDGDVAKKGPVDPQVLRMAGVALFDKNVKMLGLLNMDENRHMLWVMGLLKKMTISIMGKDGTSSLFLTKINSEVKPKLGKNNRIEITVNLSGEGLLMENNSQLDPQHQKNLRILQKEFEKEAKKQVKKTITMVQKKYGTDIFGFGEVIHKKNPTRWNSLKENWDQTFSEADISVKVDLKIKQIGMTGPSLMFKESERKK